MVSERALKLLNWQQIDGMQACLTKSKGISENSEFPSTIIS